MELCARTRGSGQGSALEEEVRGGALLCDLRRGQGSELRLEVAVWLRAGTRGGECPITSRSRTGEVGCAPGFSYLTVLGVTESWLDKRPGQWPARRTVALANAEPTAQKVLSLLSLTGCGADDSVPRVQTSPQVKTTWGYPVPRGQHKPSAHTSVCVCARARTGLPGLRTCV